jgi:allophanate hydrolase
VEVEVYEVPVAALGDLLLTVAPPLAIGTVVLAGGGQAPGFVCEGYARDGVPDISPFGGWRRYRASLRAGGAGEPERATSG